MKKTTKICVPFKVSSKNRNKTNHNHLKLELSGLPRWYSGEDSLPMQRTWVQARDGSLRSPRPALRKRLHTATKA